MRCPARVLGAAVLVLLGATAGAQAPAARIDDAALRQALVQAVQARIGDDADVVVENVKTNLKTPADVTAMVDPGSRVGRYVRFSLTAPARAGEAPIAAGWATADVRATASFVALARPVSRGAELTAGDLVESRGDIGQQPLAPMPVMADVIGTHAARDLREGEPVTAALLKQQPLVRCGDTVRTRALVGRVEVFGRAVAQQSGQRNDRIKLINPDSRKSLTGLVTAAGEVVIVNEH